MTVQIYESLLVLFIISKLMKITMKSDIFTQFTVNITFISSHVKSSAVDLTARDDQHEAKRVPYIPSSTTFKILGSLVSTEKQNPILYVCLSFCCDMVLGYINYIGLGVHEVLVENNLVGFVEPNKNPKRIISLLNRDQYGIFVWT